MVSSVNIFHETLNSAFLGALQLTCLASTIVAQSYVGHTQSTWPRGSAGIGLASDHQKALGGQQHHQIVLQYSATAVALLQPSLWVQGCPATGAGTHQVSSSPGCSQHQCKSF